MAVSSVVDQQGLSTPAEVIVVDNGSREPVTNRWGPGVRVLSERRPGSYAARNAGVLASTGEVIAFLDSDCVATPTWIRNGVAGCARDSIAVGTVRVSTRSDPTLAERFDVEYAFPQDAYFAEGWGVTANLFVGRGVFDEVGLFDKELLSGGDRDFCLRARDRGV
ncbi:MAG: glycosyltransferase, partial [Acidimicrobiales bacterium]|nr:glycosyltransferase [Acidimicrobiales bacterium]